ncbi:MAG: NAD(P)-dependent alcohol dehydrogenase [Bdellovibrionota bacterium]
MKAAVCQKYNDPNAIQIIELPTPQLAKNEVLIKVYATSVQTADWRIQSQNLPYGFSALGRIIFGFSKPRQPILGTDLSGEIVAVGDQVQRFKKGDKVVHVAGPSMGCHVEYKCVNENAILALKPEKLSHAQATALPFGYFTAWTFLVEKAKIKANEKILIVGASGSVGIAAVQIAKYFQADVTAVCSSQNQNYVLSQGANQAFDYTKDYLAESATKYDIIFDAFGNLNFDQCRPYLVPQGKLVILSASLWDTLFAPILSLFTNYRVISGLALENTKLLEIILELAAKEKIQPQIDHVYKFEQIREAFLHVGQRHKKGSVVVEIF